MATATEGRSIEDMAGQDDLGLADPVDVIEGTKGQLSWSVGGIEPSSAKLKVNGITLDVAGEFRKGDEFQIVLDCRVNEVKFTDEDDPDGFPEVCIKGFGAKVDGFRRLSEDETKALRKLLAPPGE